MALAIMWPRSKPAPILPRRTSRRDAEDVADELIAKVLLQREAFALFITPCGEYRSCRVKDIRFQDWCERWPTSLCGIYDSDVEREGLIEDVLGMEWQQP